MLSTWTFWHFECQNGMNRRSFFYFHSDFQFHEVNGCVSRTMVHWYNLASASAHSNKQAFLVSLFGIFLRFSVSLFYLHLMTVQSNSLYIFIYVYQLYTVHMVLVWSFRKQARQQSSPRCIGLEFWKGYGYGGGFAPCEWSPYESPHLQMEAFCWVYFA